MWVSADSTTRTADSTLWRADGWGLIPATDTVTADSTTHLADSSWWTADGWCGIAAHNDYEYLPGGSGYPVYWQGKRRKRRLEEQPNLHLKKVLDDVVAELYGELTEDEVPPEVQAKAAKLVKPFVKKTDKKLAIPPEAAVDWQALEKDAARVRQLVALWRKHEVEAEIDAEDEYLLLMA